MNLVNHKVIEWLHKTLPSGMTILELGSGEGTIELAKFWNVVSVEHDSEWLGLSDKSRYIHAPLTLHKPISKFEGTYWYDREILKKALAGLDYDLLYIDGPVHPNRCGIVKYEHLFNRSVPWVLDDMHRKAEKQIVHSLAAKHRKSYTVHNSCGPHWPFAVL